MNNFEDFTQIFNNIIIPPGNYGIPRSHMPQIDAQHLFNYTEWVRQQGYTIKRKSLPVASLKLVQNEVNKFKVLSIMCAIEKGTTYANPILVSADGYVIDGSHRMIALLNCKNRAKIETLEINSNALDLIELSRKFNNVKFRNVSSSGGGE